MISWAAWAWAFYFFIFIYLFFFSQDSGSAYLYQNLRKNNFLWTQTLYFQPYKNTQLTNLISYTL